MSICDNFCYFQVKDFESFWSLKCPSFLSFKSRYHLRINPKEKIPVVKTVATFKKIEKHNPKTTYRIQLLFSTFEWASWDWKSKVLPKLYPERPLKSNLNMIWEKKKTVEHILLYRSYITLLNGYYFWWPYLSDFLMEGLKGI